MESKRMTKYQIAEQVMLAGLDGFDGRLPAAQQREVFGRAIFGKKRVQIDASGQGMVRASYSCAFGTDSAHADFSFEEVARFANEPQRPVMF